ncbi:MAG: hypothetical protein ACQEQF_10975 [Bacillota bacterium]
MEKYEAVRYVMTIYDWAIGIYLIVAILMILHMTTNDLTKRYDNMEERGFSISYRNLIRAFIIMLMVRQMGVFIANIFM